MTWEQLALYIGIPIIGALIVAVWVLLNKKIDSAFDDIGKLYSRVNDLEVDYAALNNQVGNHDEKFKEIIDNVKLLTQEIRESIRRIEDKLDDFRERRG